MVTMCHIQRPFTRVTLCSTLFFVGITSSFRRTFPLCGVFASQISLAIGFHNTSSILCPPWVKKWRGVRAVWDRDGPSLSSCFQISQSVNIVASCSIFVESTQKRHRNGAAAVRSPAVKPGHGYKILTLRWSLSTLSAVIDRTETS